jgi:hypothetical protein
MEKTEYSLLSEILEQTLQENKLDSLCGLLMKEDIEYFNETFDLSKMLLTPDKEDVFAKGFFDLLKNPEAEE